MIRKNYCVEKKDEKGEMEESVGAFLEKSKREE